MLFFSFFFKLVVFNNIFIDLIPYIQAYLHSNLPTQGSLIISTFLQQDWSFLIMTTQRRHVRAVNAEQQQLSENWRKELSDTLYIWGIKWKFATDVSWGSPLWGLIERQGVCTKINGI